MLEKAEFSVQHAKIVYLVSTEVRKKYILILMRTRNYSSRQCSEKLCHQVFSP